MNRNFARFFVIVLGFGLVTPVGLGASAAPVRVDDAAGGVVSSRPDLFEHAYRARELPAPEVTSRNDASHQTQRRARAKKPKARLRVSADVVRVGQKVRVSTKGSKAKRGVRSAVLTFGDGKRARAHKAKFSRTHRYSKKGHYTVRLVITDRKAAVARARAKVRVVGKKVPIPARRGLGGRSVPPNQRVGINNASAPAALAGAAAPASVDLRKYAAAVQNQGDLSSCVAWAAGYGLTGWYYKKKTGATQSFAPMYVYSQTNGGRDQGSYVKDALGVLRSQGIDTAAHYGSGWATNWWTKPTASQRASAASYRLVGGGAIFAKNSGVGVKSAGPNAAETTALRERLAAGSPVVVAIRVRSDLYSYKSGWYKASGQWNGSDRHAMLAVGYNPTGLIIQNSWGSGAGQNGYVFMTWDAVRKDLYEASFVNDAVFTSGTPSDVVKPTMTSFSKRFADGFAANNAAAPMSFNWSGTDNKAVTQYVLWYRVNGGDWAQLAINPLQTEAVYNLSFNYRYEFAVAALDAAGNQSDWYITQAFTPRNFDQSVGTYSAGWIAVTGSAYMNGSTYYTTAASARMDVWVTGQNFGLVGTRWSNAGGATIYVDDQYFTTINTYAADTRYRQVVLWLNLAQQRQYKISVVTSGTAWFDVDSFLVSD